MACTVNPAMGPNTPRIPEGNETRGQGCRPGLGALGGRGRVLPSEGEAGDRGRGRVLPSEGEAGDRGRGRVLPSEGEAGDRGRGRVPCSTRHIPCDAVLGNLGQVDVVEGEDAAEVGEVERAGPHGAERPRAVLGPAMMLDAALGLIDEQEMPQ